MYSPEVAGKILRVKELVKVSEDMVMSDREQREASRGYRVVETGVYGCLERIWFTYCISCFFVQFNCLSTDCFSVTSRLLFH